MNVEVVVVVGVVVEVVLVVAAVAAVGHEEGLTETEPPIAFAYCISMLLAMLVLVETLCIERGCR